MAAKDQRDEHSWVVCACSASYIRTAGRSCPSCGEDAAQPMPLDEPRDDFLTRQLWPRVDTVEQARDAMRRGGQMAIVLAVLAAARGSLGSAGARAEAVLAAVLYLLLAWRMYRASLRASYAAAALYCVHWFVYWQAFLVAPALFLFVSVIALRFLNAVRGGRAFGRLTAPPPATPGPEPRQRAQLVQAEAAGPLLPRTESRILHELMREPPPGG